MVDQLLNPGRSCPECTSREYVFRGRKEIAPEPGKAPAIETRYLCKDCGHTWREQVPVKGAG
jgi:transposase-like protein